METKSLKLLSYFVLGFLVIEMLLASASVVTGISVYQAYTNLPAGVDINEDLIDEEVPAMIVTFIRIASLLVLYVLFGCWIYRMNKNLQSMSQRTMDHGPGWSVGWYFIPIANLFKPYHAMSEMWEVAHQDEHPGRGILSFWWAAWIISLIAARIASKLNWNAVEFDEYITATHVTIYSDGLDVVCALAAFLLVYYLHRAYERNRFKCQPNLSTPMLT